jgi:deoxyribodipyrimidine photo-lyase
VAVPRRALADLRASLRAGDVSSLAARRQRRLAEECETHRLALDVTEGVTVVPPGALTPTPTRIALPTGVDPGELPEVRGGAGGEAAARRTLRAFHFDGYADKHDDLASDGTSRLSPYLRFGCLSPRELAGIAVERGAEEFVRQLCWRDFFYQVAAAFPRLNREALRPGGDAWRADDDALAAWRSGLTGVPIVDVPNNYGNWQWVAGTGNDTKPYRRFNPIRQAHRFDPSGDYVRTYAPELAGVAGAAVHEPWRLPADARRALRYPPPLTSGAAAGWLPE